MKKRMSQDQYAPPSPRLVDPCNVGARAGRRFSDPLSAAVVALVAAVASPAQAAPEANGSARQDAAEALYQQGQSLLEGGKLEAACEKFAASAALQRGVGTLLHLADCYERVGRFASAIEAFSEAARLAQERGDEEREHLAKVRVAALEPRAPVLKIASKAAREKTPGLQITLNGIPLTQEKLNRPARWDAGDYELRVSAPGYETFVSRVRLSNGGEPATLTVPPLVAAAPDPALREASSPVDEGDSDTGIQQETWAYVAGGAGVALAIVSGVLTSLAASRNSDSKAGCQSDSPNLCNQQGVSLRDEALTFANYATIAGITAGVAVAAGVTLYVTAPGAEDGAPEGAFIGVAFSTF